MKITSVVPIFADRFLFVKIITDNGLVGIGESGAWGFCEHLKEQKLNLELILFVRLQLIIKKN